MDDNVEKDFLGIENQIKFGRKSLQFLSPQSVSISCSFVFRSRVFFTHYYCSANEKEYIHYYFNDSNTKMVQYLLYFRLKNLRYDLTKLVPTAALQTALLNLSRLTIFYNTFADFVFAIFVPFIAHREKQIFVPINPTKWYVDEADKHSCTASGAAHKIKLHATHASDILCFLISFSMIFWCGCEHASASARRGSAAAHGTQRHRPCSSPCIAINVAIIFSMFCSD